MVSDRQKQLKKRMYIFGSISFAIWLITSVVMLCLAISNVFPPEPTTTIPADVQVTISEEMKTRLIALAVTVGIGIAGVIIIKDKIRVFMWMCCVIIGACLYNRTGMCIILGIWFIDEYVFRNLYLYYKNKLKIRKEIDA